MSSVIPDCYVVVRYVVDCPANRYEWPTLCRVTAERAAAKAELRDSPADRRYFLVLWHFVSDEPRFVEAGRGRGIEFELGDFSLRHLLNVDYRDWMRRAVVNHFVNAQPAE